MPKNNQNLKAVKKSICQTLIDSNNLFLKALGFFCKAFGFKSLIFISIGFVLGIALLYYFIVFKGMEIIGMTKKTEVIVTTDEPKKFNLRFNFKTAEGKILKNYIFYLTSSIFPPVTTKENGIYDLENIPYNKDYRIFVTNLNYYPIECHSFGELEEVVDNGIIYKELKISNFPDPAVVIEGVVTDINGKVINGDIEIDGKSGKIGKNGEYCLAGIKKIKRNVKITNQENSKIYSGELELDESSFTGLTIKNINLKDLKEE